MELSFLAAPNPQTMSLYFKAEDKGNKTNVRDYFQRDSVAGSVYSPDKVTASCCLKPSRPACPNELPTAPE